ncbi:MAG: helix-turn-helix domain-containing protein [Deltaproteobacteria bacterium]|nr:helix-turn-helix domain-containing protein [Deltaproteobacteria bacterium]
MLKPQDVVVALALHARPGQPYAGIAAQCHISAAEAHAAVKRLIKARLVNPERGVNRRSLVEFLVHGVRYVWPAEFVGVTTGMPTAGEAPGLQPETGNMKAFPEPEFGPWVWPSPHGRLRGIGIVPLYASVPDAADQDPHLYRLLALIDAIRAGGARDRNEAERLLKKEMSLVQ